MGPVWQSSENPRNNLIQKRNGNWHSGQLAKVPLILKALDIQCHNGYEHHIATRGHRVAQAQYQTHGGSS